MPTRKPAHARVRPPAARKPTKPAVRTPAPSPAPVVPAAAPSPGSSSAAAVRVDRDLAARAYRKLMDGGDLTREERRALKRHEADKEERLRWQYYRSIPQKHWRAMSGRQAKVINEQAERYGLPFGGAEIDLPKLARALHDFLAENAVKLARDEDPLLQGGSSPALERYREERAALARLDRLERERSLVPRDEARAALGRVAGILRGAGDALQRQFGAGAVEVLYEALDDAGREVDRTFGEAEPAGRATTPPTDSTDDDNHDDNASAPDAR